MKLIQDLGRRYPKPTSKTKSRYGLYECECGNQFETITRKTMTSRCKLCAAKLNATVHGKGKTKLNHIWNAMKSRCYSPTNSAYANYGGRGIKISDEWKTDFLIFHKWAIQHGYKEGLQIDRINNDEGYYPENCRWIDKAVQARNTRILMKTNTSGYRGVGLKKLTGKFYAAITVNNKTKHLGYFETAEEAAQAYNTYVDLNNLEHTKNII